VGSRFHSSTEPEPAVLNRTRKTTFHLLKSMQCLVTSREEVAKRKRDPSSAAVKSSCPQGTRAAKNCITRNGGCAPIIVVKLLRTDAWRRRI